MKCRKDEIIFAVSDRKGFGFPQLRPKFNRDVQLQSIQIERFESAGIIEDG
jgi:hypothetical protein